MRRFSEIDYVRPDYTQAREELTGYKDRLARAASYEEVRRLWLTMKQAVQTLEYAEETAYIRYLCGVSDTFYREEVRIHNAEDPKIAALQNECDEVFLACPYIAAFGSEFGDRIVALLRNNAGLSNAQTVPLQAEEAQLRADYTSLLATGRKSAEISGQSYDILDKLIRVRTEIAQALGFRSYIEMAYRLHGRTDYGISELSAFRAQIRRLITPVCAELRKTETIRYPDADITDPGGVMAAIGDMFRDISAESGAYIDEILGYEYYDLADRPHKRPDCFCCCMLPRVKMPFIIGCFHGGGLEVNSLIHELGHGYAFYTAARSQKLYEYHRAATSVNEIHSKSMEHFAYPYLERFFGEKKRAYIHNHLFHSFDNLPYRCAIDEYEHALYETPALSRVERCELWAETERRYMPWRESDPAAIRAGAYWPNQSHLFTHPFYYIEYDIAQISVLEFYGRSKEDYARAWRDYARLCRTGGSLGYSDLLKVGNLTRPFDENAVEKICAPAIDELFSTR